MAQQPLLAGNAAAVTGHRTICTNHPVTWNNNRNRIAAIPDLWVVRWLGRDDKRPVRGDVAVGHARCVEGETNPTLGVE